MLYSYASMNPNYGTFKMKVTLVGDDEPQTETLTMFDHTPIERFLRCFRNEVSTAFASTMFQVGTALLQRGMACMRNVTAIRLLKVSRFYYYLHKLDQVDFLIKNINSPKRRFHILKHKLSQVDLVL